MARFVEALSGGLWLRPAFYLASLLAVIAGAFGGLQTIRLGEARHALATSVADQTALLNQLAAGTAAIAEKTASARAEFDRTIPQILAAQQEALSDAKIRHQGLVADIAAGNRRLRPEWMPGCAPAVPGESAGGVEPAREDPYRAAAVGRVLGIGARADVFYETCRAELTATETLLAACYDGGKAK